MTATHDRDGATANPSGERGYERSDLHPKYVVYFAIALAGVTAMVSLVVWWLFLRFQQQAAGADVPPRQLSTSPTPVPEPRLEITPQEDLLELRRQEEEILNTYQWIDREKGIARIPLERAMQVYLERQKQ